MNLVWGLMDGKKKGGLLLKISLISLFMLQLANAQMIQNKDFDKVVQKSTKNFKSSLISVFDLKEKIQSKSKSKVKVMNEFLF